eukprot:TRINITY_DN25168_c0_g1_i1.p1 TRINITY_DN25168_c0_g1~~TRINITY_DN25168_c0_g1_i1.p1  ORF type:complete len:218 (+),score=31.76 TRINITY_DN25168_c0_g1_i1:105-758(+)
MSCFLAGAMRDDDVADLVSQTSLELSKLKTQRFHVHLHSNNGTFVWAALLQAFQQTAPGALQSLRGIVFDSAPRLTYGGQDSIVALAFGFTFPAVPIILRRNVYVHPIWTPALFIYFLVKFIGLRLRATQARKFTLAALKETLVSGMPTNVPQLYVYSKKDQLISSSAVEEYIAMQKKNGVTVSWKLFDDTPHVQHFLRREADYREVLKTFLAKGAC